MKKNLILFGIFVALLGVTFIFQEKKMEKAYTEELVKDRLYTGELKSLTVSGVAAEKKEGQWLSGDKLLSHNQMKLIEDKIHQLKKIKSITGDPKDFLGTPLEFSVNGDLLRIGELSLDKQGFYLAKNGELMLAVLEGSSTELTTNEQDVVASKLHELKGLLSKSPAELTETQLFRYYPKLPMERVTIKVPGNLPFEIDLKNNQTSPPPFPGVFPHENLALKFQSLLSQVTLKEEVPFGPFGEKLAEITFMGGGKGVMWELWMKNKKTADAILTDPVRKKAWFMVGGTLKIFFIQLQDYWDKKNIPASNFKPFTSENMVFTEGRLRTIVALINKEPLEFESQGFKVDKERMTELVSYALNLGPLDQASRVSLLSNSEKKQMMSESHLRVELFGEELLFWIKKEEIIIVNLSQGFKCHYPRAENSMGFQFKDVLK